MPIMTVPSAPYPPGITGDPYTPDNISKFYDMNWVGNSGLLSTGLTAPGLHGLRGLGCGCSETDESGNCLDPDPCGGTLTFPGQTPTPPITTPPATGGITDSNAACGAGWSIVLDGSGNPICQQNVSTPLNTPLTPAQAGLTPAQQAQLIAATGNSAVSLIRTAAGGPYTVAGTNLVYNPATGALTTATAVNATASLTAGLASIGPYVPMIALVIAAVLIVPKLVGGK